MDIQQIIALALGAVALFLVGRHVWAEARGLVNPDEAGGCPGCGMCDAAEAEATPSMNKTPLVSLQTKLPPHLQRLRRNPGAHEE